MKASSTLAVVFAAMLVLGGCAGNSQCSDVKLASLQAELDAAVTTFDMNCKSLQIYEYLDNTVAALEARIKNDLDPQFMASFEKSSALWREYRMAEADLAYDECEGGSIRTLMRNGVLIRLTEERLAHLQDRDPEGRYKGEPTEKMGQ